MSLYLTPRTLGYPDWEPVPVGDITTTLTQYYDLRSNPRCWKPVPWFTDDKFVCRPENNYRRPVSFRAHVDAILACKRKLFMRYVFRQKIVK